jgi:uncharacterized protein YprB with RNaseH-like and TPR domain
MIRGHHPRSGFLERRLAELSRKRAAGECEAASETPATTARDGAPQPSDGAAPSIERIGFEEFLPGVELSDGEGTVYLHEQLRSAIEKPRPEWGRLRRGRSRSRSRALSPPEWLEETPWRADYEIEDDEISAPWEEDRMDPPLPLEILHRELEELVRRGLGSAVYLDLETCGLTQACVFLAGTMQWNGEDFVLRQYLARDYSEERGLLSQLARYLDRADTLITFNGKSFDVPMLRDRGLIHGVEIRTPEKHVDLLHHARARWRDQLPNCRLITLEAYICQRRRSGDVPGGEIPGLYHHFVKQGDPYRLIPVLHHNLLDVITMDEILRALVES